MVAMADGRSVFPLRFHDARLRELVREVAARERVSQNELIEQAVENEVVARGGRLAEDLAEAAARLASLTEAEPEPLQARALHSDPAPAAATGQPPAVPTDRLGVLAAYSAGRG
jgi:hypothetical protein